MTISPISVPWLVFWLSVGFAALGVVIGVVLHSMWVERSHVCMPHEPEQCGGKDWYDIA